MNISHRIFEIGPSCNHKDSTDQSPPPASHVQTLSYREIYTAYDLPAALHMNFDLDSMKARFPAARKGMLAAELSCASPGTLPTPCLLTVGNLVT